MTHQQPHPTGPPATGAVVPVDAVGRALAVGDTVWAVVGTSGERSTVRRLSVRRVVVERADGLLALLRPSSVVGLRPVAPAEVSP